MEEERARKMKGVHALALRPKGKENNRKRGKADEETIIIGGLLTSPTFFSPTALSVLQPGPLTGWDTWEFFPGLTAPGGAHRGP